jgi:hypothetical protein
MNFAEALQVFAGGFVCALLVMPRPVDPVVSKCPDRNECWDVCVSMATIATDSAKRTCTNSVETEALLHECDDALSGLQDDTMDHWGERLDARIDEISWALHTGDCLTLEATEGDPFP